MGAIYEIIVMKTLKLYDQYFSKKNGYCYVIEQKSSV